jgi:hypothetical protein
MGYHFDFQNNLIYCLFLEIQDVTLKCDLVVNSNNNGLLCGLSGNVRETGFQIRHNAFNLGTLISIMSLYI